MLAAKETVKNSWKKYVEVLQTFSSGKALRIQPPNVFFATYYRTHGSATPALNNVARLRCTNV